MKKILILLGVASLNITSVSTIISCDNSGGISYEEISDNINLLEVGKDIDKTIGPDQNNRNNYQNNSFTNGGVASIILNNKLQFSQLKPADQNNFPDEWNRNFAIAGATASEYNSMAASMIYNNVSIRKQTGRLISQNIINSNDLILISIGGNDLRNIISLVNNHNERVKALNKIIKDIEIALYMLANNGAKRVLLMSPPNMGLVPEFNNKSVNQKSKEIITNFSKMFNQKTAEIVKNINGHYKNVVKQWSLYNNMSNLFEEFKKLRENADVTVNFSRSTPPVVGRMLGEILANPNPDVPKDANPDDYFFFDQLHPSWQIHQIVANKLYDFVQEW